MVQLSCLTTLQALVQCLQAVRKYYQLDKSAFVPKICGEFWFLPRVLQGLAEMLQRSSMPMAGSQIKMSMSKLSTSMVIHPLTSRLVLLMES